MNDNTQTKDQLLDELPRLRQQLSEMQQTEKRSQQAEEALAHERDMLRALMDSMPDHIYFKDAQSRIIKTNPAHARALGLSDPKEAIGKTDFDLFSREEAQRFYDEEQRIMQSGQPVIARMWTAQYATGEELWLSETKVPIPDQAGQIVGLVGISRDVTDLKQAEARAESAHQLLVEASRRAGMAEVATGVLHNVGNVLNSVNVSTNLISERMKSSHVTSVGKLAQLLSENSADLGRFFTEDERGRQLPGYVAKLAQHLAQEQRTLLEEFESSIRNVDHIKEIVAMQQSYATRAGIIETIAVTELVEDALRIHTQAYLRHGVKIVREFSPTLPMPTDRHKVLQILVNLLSNAKYACDEGGAAEKVVTVRVRSDGPDRVRIELADNGVGIPPENLTRIFGHGFTTRRSGHGFGLHSSALAATEMGGKLTAHSDGPGQGAHFVLELRRPPGTGDSGPISPPIG